MKKLARRTLLFLAIDIALVIFCVLHIPAIIHRAQAPFTIQDFHGRVLIGEIADPVAAGDLRPGDELLEWNNTRLNDADVAEFLADLASVNQRVELTLKRDAQQFHSTIHLVHSYSLAYVIIVCCIGVITWCLGVFILVSRPGNLIATTLHWAMVSMAVAVVTAYEGTTPASPAPLLSSLLFCLSYCGTASAFLLFTMLFPRRKPIPIWAAVPSVFFPPAVIAGFMLYHNARAFANVSPGEFIQYSFWFRLLHVLLIVYVVGGILSFVHSYICARGSEERKKLKWILWGLCVGPFPLLFLFIVPHEIGLQQVVHEEYALLPLVIIPISFAVSFIKYQLLDIEVIIRRTTAYAIVIGTLLVAYVVVASAVAAIVGTLTASAGTAILVALLFEPVRSRVQHLVDKRFFRVQYNFREAEQHFIESIKRSLTIPHLGETLVRETSNLLAVERIGFFTLRAPGNFLDVVTHTGFDILEKHAPRLEIEKLQSGLLLPVACDDSVETDIQHESADAEVFQRWNIALALALLSQNSDLLGVLVLGNKKSGLRFSAEDVDLLRNVCTQASLTIERITLQRQLFIEHEESQHFKTLNQLKSDFVSYVSHELRTPLTSIKMFAEMLKNQRPRSNKKREKYVGIILGETDRLDRMVTTILDSARIDRDLKMYELKEGDLVEMAKAALDTMDYHLKSQGFRVEFSCKVGRSRSGRQTATVLAILADRDAVIRAITNVIGNAIKYSGERKYLKVSILREHEHGLCRIRDKGVGIAPAVIPNLFEKFYRDPAYSRQVSGVGLGLPLVKHIMNAHSGSVEVESTPGRGSTFTLSFPLIEQK